MQYSRGAVDHGEHWSFKAIKRGKMEHWSNGVIQQWICGAEEQLYSRAVEQWTIDWCTDAKILDEIQTKDF